MQITVLMSSGDVDEWTNVAETVQENGFLFVLDWLEDRDPKETKTLEIHSKIPKGERIDLYQVLALYAPGMWMKVEFE